MQRCRENGKVFLAEVGKNYWGEFLNVTEIFQGGRKVSVMIPKELGGKGWSSFGRALKALLSLEEMEVATGKAGTGSIIAGSFVDGKRSFVDVVRSKDGVAVKGNSHDSVGGGSGVGMGCT